MKEKSKAMEWFRAKHDELAETARANLAAHDLETGREAYHLDSIYYATAEQMEAICPTGIDFDRLRPIRDSGERQRRIRRGRRALGRRGMVG